jgi:hypothetical protein
VHHEKSKKGLLTNLIPPDAKGMSSLEKAEDLCRKKKPKLAVPYILKAIQDENNLDAFIQAAFLLDIEGALEALETAELRGT